MQNIPLYLQISANFIFILKQLFPHSLKIEKIRKNNVLKITNYLQANLKKENLDSGRHLEVERRENLTEKEFVDEYFKKCKPVIFEKAAADWACTKKWNLSLIKEKYPEKLYNIIQWPTENPSVNIADKKDHVLRKISGKEFVDGVKQGKRLYLRACPILEEQPELRSDIDQGWLDKMQQCFFGVAYQSFISSGGLHAPLHCESTSAFFIVVEGRKKWTMFRSKDFALLYPESARIPYKYSSLDLNNIDYKKFPGIEYLDRYVCEVKKGDILYVPSWIWHFVETPIESWAISYKFSSIRNFLSNPIFVFDRLFLVDPNIFSTLYYSFFKSNMGSRSKNPLIPKLYVKRSNK